jgi:transcriptional regulator with XRE-family HTH domain
MVAGYSEDQFGARAGLHPMEVAALEGGERNVSLSLVERLADALQLPVSSLLREAERESA